MGVRDFEKYGMIAIFAGPAYVFGRKEENNNVKWHNTIGAYFNIQTIAKFHEVGVGIDIYGILNNHKHSAGVRLVIYIGNRK